MCNSVQSLLGCLVTHNVNVDPVPVNTSICSTVHEKHTDIFLIEEAFTSSPNLPNWVRN